MSQYPYGRPPYPSYPQQPSNMPFQPQQVQPGVYPPGYPSVAPIQQFPAVANPYTGSGSAPQLAQPGVPGFVVNPYKDNNVRWVPSTKTTYTSLTGSALVAGHEGWDGSPLWVIRARHAGDLLPGKLAAKHASAFLPHGDQEIRIDNFEVLCVNPSAVRWQADANGRVPPRAVIGGQTVNGEKLYIGRTPHQGSLTPGKIHRNNGCLYISYGGREVSFRNYEVLVTV